MRHVSICDERGRKDSAPSRIVSVRFSSEVEARSLVFQMRPCALIPDESANASLSIIGSACCCTLDILCRAKFSWQASERKSKVLTVVGAANAEDTETSKPARRVAVSFIVSGCKEEEVGRTLELVCEGSRESTLREAYILYIRNGSS
jgi:hypothetical protein